MSVTSVQGRMMVPADTAERAPPPLLLSKRIKFLDAVQTNEYPHTVAMERGLVHQHFERVDSTQIQARQLVNLLPDDTWAILSAEEQTEGQGMHGRRWLSPPHVNMYATFMFLLPRDNQVSRISQITAIAVARTLQEFGFQPQIKWPNDVLLNRKKVCGVLCELMTQDDPCRYVCVAGIGLNINMEKGLCESLDQPVTSMFVESGKKFSTRDVTSRVFRHMQECIGLFCHPGNDFSSLYSEFDGMLAFKGETVLIEPEAEPSSPVLGTFLGITRQGYLQLEVAGAAHTLVDGRLKPIAAAQ